MISFSCDFTLRIESIDTFLPYVRQYRVAYYT